MNINEIAKLAGVSRATISRYLNNGYVSEEKREIIKRVIEETGYQPSSQAQMLRTKKTQLIGVIIPKINSDTVSRMVAGISLILSEQGYQLLLANTDNNEKEELKYLRLFKDNKVDGVILIGTIFTREHKKLLQELNVPVVILGQRLDGYSCVYHDDFQASYKLTERMLQKGKKMGYIGVTQKDEAAGKNRKNGFVEACMQYKIEVERECMIEGDFTLQSGYENAKKLLQVDSKLDSIFCATDNIAIGAMMYLREVGIKIPNQIQIVGFGDTPMSLITTPKITTVHFFYKTSGMEAAKMLLDMLNGHIQVQKQLKMSYEIIERESIRIVQSS